MRTGVVVAALAVLVGCGDEPVGPKTEEFSQEREALMQRIARTKAEKGDAPVAKKKKQTASEPGSVSIGKVDVAYSYDSTGKRDPFRSFEWERPDRRNPDELRGPLEKFDLGQLDLVAVVWKTDNAKALVKDPSGQSYIIGNGTKIGKNDGRVMKIGDNSVVVKETYVDHLGQKSTKDIEMRIRGSQGG